MQKALIAVVAASFAAIIGCSSAPTPAPSAAVKSGTGSIVRLDAGLDAVVPSGAAVEKLAGGFQFLEGPLWRPSEKLWFSDLVGNVVHQWMPDGRVTDILN